MFVFLNAKGEHPMIGKSVLHLEENKFENCNCSFGMAKIRRGGFVIQIIKKILAHYRSILTYSVLCTVHEGPYCKMDYSKLL